jgi:uncharacterized protein YcfJ
MRNGGVILPVFENIIASGLIKFILKKVHLRRRGKMKRWIVSLVIVTLSLSGLTSCATTKNDRGRTQAEGAGAGAVAGALIGGIIGAATGDSKSAIVGAAIGAVAGGAAGYAYGTHIANEKEKYAHEEDWLNACIASAEKVNQETMKYNAKLGKDIKTLEAETVQLKAAYLEKKDKKLTMDKEKKKIEIKLAEARETLKRAKFELENQEKVLAETKAKRNDVYAKKFETKIEELNGYIAELETQTEALASMSQRMSV